MPGPQTITTSLTAVAMLLAVGCAPLPEPPSSAQEPPPEAAMQPGGAVKTEVFVDPSVAAGEPGAAAIAIPGDLQGEALRGWEIFDDTPHTLETAAALRGEEYDGNALSCRNCHLEHGTRARALPLTRIGAERYSPREGGVLGVAQRVNACLQRAHNATPLPSGSPELAALLAYLKRLGDLPVTKESPAKTLDLPPKGAEPARGEGLFHAACASCHGDEGGNAPALWGDQSYGSGSGMHRLLVATAFIHGNMPPEGAGDALSAADAYHVAAFINSLERPVPPGLDRDYPALTEKPIDCPYPPFPDSFSQQQHQFGPFGPIEEERKLQLQADRWVYWAAPFAQEPTATLSGTIPPSAEE